MVRRGMGRERLQRGAYLRPRRHSDWKDSSSGNVRQSLLRRRQEKPVVHGRQPVSVFALCRDGRRGGGLVAPKPSYPPSPPPAFGLKVMGDNGLAADLVRDQIGRAHV